MSKCNVAIKYRIYPNAEQEILIHKIFGCCRKIWNLMLNDRNEHYKNTKETLKPKPATYKKEFDYLKEVDSLALANVQLNLERAFNDFFNDIKKKTKNKKHFPKFKSKKKAKKSYTTNLVNDNIILTEKYIKLPKLGKVKLVMHRTPKDAYVLKSVTVSQDSKGSYYVSVLFEYESEASIIDKNNITNVIGLDYKSDGLYTDSNGNYANMPHFYRNTQKKLAKAQRKLAKKVGNKKEENKSNNYYKQLKKVNKIQTKVAIQRKDFLHKLSNEITNRYEVICVEDIDMKSLSNRGFRNGKATMDNGFGMFRLMLQYKQERKGHYFIKIDKFFPSSQNCSYCGTKNPEMKELRIRTFVCPNCGNVIDRDYNAAINIKNEGLRTLLA